MKYVLVKNAELNANCSFTLESGEIICESNNYDDCEKNIPFPYDRPEMRLNFIKDEWASILNSEAEQGILFCEQMKDIKFRYNEGLISKIEFINLDYDLVFDALRDTCSFFYRSNKYISLNEILDYHLYAKHLLSQPIPDNITECLNKLSQIISDLTAKKQSYANDLTSERTNEPFSNSIESICNEELFVNNESDAFLSEFYLLLLNQDLSDATVNAFFHNNFESFDTHPDAICFYEGEFGYDDFSKFGETYTIYIDFSDPTALFSEIMSEIDNLGGRQKNYWLEEFYEDVLVRFLVPNTDNRTTAEISQDIDNLESAIIKKLNLSEKEWEWLNEDLLK